MPNNIYSDKEIKASFWYITHRVLLRKVFIMVLALLGGGLVLYGAWGLVDHYVIDLGKNRALENDLGRDKLNFAVLSEVNRPADLVLLETKVFPTSANTYDFLTVIVNQNKQWAVESFDYYFNVPGGKTELRTEFILPEQTKYAFLANYSSPGKITSAEIVLENIKWKKVTDYAALAGKIFLFEYANQVVLASGKSGLSEKEAVTRVGFDIKNLSAYNFWEPRFVVVLYRNDVLLSAFPVVLDGLSSSEVKTETINLFQKIDRATKVDIIPDINILDPQVFKGYDSQVGDLK